MVAFNRIRRYFRFASFSAARRPPAFTSIFLSVDRLILPLPACPAARDLAFARWAASSIGYLRCAGSAKSEEGRALRRAVVSLAIKTGFDVYFFLALTAALAPDLRLLDSVFCGFAAGLSLLLAVTAGLLPVLVGIVQV